MALQPTDFDDKAEQNNKAFLAALEKSIDKALEHAFSQCNPTEVTIPIYYCDYHRLENKVLFDRLKAMYKGWGVRKFTNKDYEGDNYYLIFRDIRK